MKERPIIFNAEMVRAILDGRKTQTRRVMKPQPPGETTSIYPIKNTAYFDCFGAMPLNTSEFKGDHNFLATTRCPYGVPGDRLWVRETWGINHGYRPFLDSVVYRTDGAGLEDFEGIKNRWRPSIHMPRKHSRINLLITGVRVERVQEISEEDARAEGCVESVSDDFCSCHLEASMLEPDHECDYRTVRRSFAILWDSINEKRGFGWDENPWVWVVEFEAVPK